MNKPFDDSVPQAHNPLHGVTLAAMLEALVAHFGWAALGKHMPVRCFTHDPSMGSSLKFLRKTPWARAQAESLYLFMLRDIKRQKDTALAAGLAMLDGD